MRQQYKHLWIVAGSTVAGLVMIGACGAVAENAVEDKPTSDPAPQVQPKEETPPKAEPEESRTEPEAPEESKTPDTEPSDSFTVTRVIDGDTIEVNGGNDVRLIGIDTPERGDCGYDEATDHLRSLIDGETVRLESDSSQDNKDRYDRLLRYVWLDGKNINLTMIEDGYAEEYTYSSPYKYHDQFNSADDGTKAFTCESTPPVAPPPADPAPAPLGDLDCGDFGSQAEAQDYLLPGDPMRLDRDGDGQACDSLS